MKLRIFSRRGGWSEAKDTSYRSGLEVNISKQLDSAGVAYSYEKHIIEYEIPKSKHKYYPDFILPNGIIIEGKGIFDVKDRQKHLLIKKQYPDLDIRFVFSNPNQKLRKGGKTTYADWCLKNDFKYARGLIPDPWIREKGKQKKDNSSGLIKRKEQKQD